MLKVLLVDDEPLVIEGLRTMIDWDGLGYTICGEALSGAEAMKLIQDCKPDLVMTDIHMPVLNGLELIEASNRMLHKPPKFVILSGYDHFEYAQTAMRQRVAEYVLKPIDDEEIEGLLKKLRETILQEGEAERNRMAQHRLAKAHILHRLVQGEWNEDLAQRASRLLQVFDDTELLCLIAEGGKLPEHVLERDSSPAGWHFEDGTGRLGLLLRAGDPSAESVYDFCVQLQREMSGAASVPVVISISGKGTGLASIRRIYLQAAELCICKSSQGKSGVFSFQDSANKIETNMLPNDSLKKVSSLIEGGNLEAVEAYVGEIFAAFAEHSVRLDAIKAEVADLELTLCRRVGEMNGDPDSMMDAVRERLGSLSALEHYSSVKNYVLLLLQQSVSLMLNLKQENEHNTIYQVIQHVDAHYRSKLQLQDLAGHFHLNAAYLGQLFRKHTGASFKDYLHAKRLEEAKRMLKRTGMKISEIAQHVGYSNTDYFIQRFKSATGVLPSSYKSDADKSKEGSK